MFDQVRRRAARGVSPRDVGIVVEQNVAADGASYRVAWAGSDAAMATWHTASELTWLKPGDKCWRGD
jgi:hypothetical protein